MRDGSADRRAVDQAARQGGCISRTQALAVGMTDSMIRTRRARGHWRRTHAGVYVVGAAPRSWRHELWAAALAVGPEAVVSHTSALLLHGVAEASVPPHPLTFTAPPGKHHRVRGAVVHQMGDVLPHHAETVDGLAVTRPHRSLVDVAAKMKHRRLGGLLDHLVTERLTTLARIACCLAEVRRPGKPGMRTLGAVLDERGDGYVPPASELEARLFRLLAEAGLPQPVRQIALPGRGAIHGLVDAAYPDARLIIEADGRRWHSRLDDLRRDRQRDAEAARAGWLTLRFLHEQIVQEPAEVAATVADVRRTRLAHPTAA